MTAIKRYTIIAGVNGVGKSSLIGAFVSKSNELGVIIDADKLALDYNGDRLKGGKAAVKRIEDCLEKGISFTQETTLSGVKTLNTIQKAKERGYFISMNYVGVDSVEESIKRIQNRVAKGGHNIAAKDVYRRYEKRCESLAAVLPYCDEVVFYDNENGFRECAEYKNGILIPKGDNIPNWLKELKAYLHNKY